MEAIEASMSALEQHPMFVGVMMLLVNIGSRYVILEISESTEEFISGEIMRKIIIFAMAFVATRKLTTALLLTGAFSAIVGGLFHEKSKYCILPKREAFGDGAQKAPSDREVLAARNVLERHEAAARQKAMGAVKTEHTLAGLAE